MMLYEVLSVEKPIDNLQNRNPAVLWDAFVQGPGMLEGRVRRSYLADVLCACGAVQSLVSVAALLLFQKDIGPKPGCRRHSRRQI